MKYKQEGNNPLHHDTWLPSEVLAQFENIEFDTWEDAQEELSRLLKLHGTYDDPNNDLHGRFGPFITENHGELEPMEFMDEALENWSELIAETKGQK